MSIKILSTVGPSSLKKEVIQKLESENVSLLRINMSHTPIEDVHKVISLLQSWVDIPVCVDTEGAQIRNQNMKSEKILFNKGGQVMIHYNKIIGDSENISFYPEHVASSLEINDTIRVDFNSVVFKVIDVTSDGVLAEVVEGGFVGSNKATNLDREIHLHPITHKDKEAITIALELGVKDFSLSFTNTAEDVLKMRQLVGESSTIISKIESINGLLNLDEILNVADSILIDRGDLSREVPIEKIPFLQRRIISQCKSAKIPVYVATNLLETMIEAKSPTRAEVNDVASTLLMGANGLVLAAETAIGLHPVDSVKMINLLIHEVGKWNNNSTFSEIINT